MSGGILGLLVSDPCLHEPSSSSYSTYFTVRLAPVPDLLAALVKWHDWGKA